MLTKTPHRCNQICDLQKIETGKNSAITALIDGLEFYKSVFLRRQNRQKKAYIASSPEHVVKAGFQKRLLPKLCGSH